MLTRFTIPEALLEGTVPAENPLRGGSDAVALPLRVGVDVNPLLLEMPEERPFAVWLELGYMSLSVNEDGPAAGLMGDR